MPRRRRPKAHKPPAKPPGEGLRQHLRRQWRWRWGGGLAAILLLVGASAADHFGWFWTVQDDWRRYHNGLFTVQAVSDLDAVQLVPTSGRGGSLPLVVRLAGIRPKDDLSADALATHESLVISAVGTWCQGQVVRLDLAARQSRDDAGNLVAFVRLPDGSLLNERLLADGLVVADSTFRHRRQKRFELLQMQAQHDQVGLWAGSMAQAQP